MRFRRVREIINNDATFGARLICHSGGSPGLKRSLGLLLRSLCLTSAMVISGLLAGPAFASEAGSAPEASGTKPPSSAFYRLPRFSTARLSPSGQYLSARVMTGSKLGLLVQPLEGDSKPYLMDTGDSWTISRTLWVGDHEILVGFYRPTSFGLDPVIVTRAMLLDMRTRKNPDAFSARRRVRLFADSGSVFRPYFGQPRLVLD